MTLLTPDDRSRSGVSPARAAASAARAPGARAALALAVAAVLAGGCGSGGHPTVPTIDVNARGRVALGALGGATVEVYRIGEYGAPVATAITSAGPDLASTGSFAFTLRDVPPEAMFLLVATGGQAHDANEDGLLDGPTPNDGKVHALASAADLAARDVRLSAVTEVVYQRARYFLEALYEDAYVAQTCDAWTTFVLRASVDGDAAIGRMDALAFDPRQHASATLRPYGRLFVPFVARLLEGLPMTPAAFDLSREELHFQDLPGQAQRVDLVGHVAYVTSGFDGLEVWDVADPTAPVRLGGVDTPGYATTIQVVGTRAYVADGFGGLRILDVTVPGTPALLRVVPTPSPVEDLHVVGDRAYLCGGEDTDATFYVADVSAPATASILGSCPLAAPSSNVRAAGGFAYVMQQGQIETFDTSDPTLPVSEGTVATFAFGRIAVASGHLFLGGDAAFEVFSLAVPAVPQPVASLRHPGLWAYDISVHGTQALLPSSADGLAVYDVANPASPVFAGLLPTSGYVSGIDRDGGLIVAGDGNGGFHTMVPGTPPPSGVVATLPRAQIVGTVDAVGDRVYVTTYGPAELVVLDATNPLAPTALGAVPLAGDFAYDVDLAGSVAYAAEYNGLFAYDVANAAAPALLGANVDLDVVTSLAPGTGVAYAIAENGGVLGVYDTSDPAHINLLDSLLLPGQAHEVAIDGDALVLASGHDGIYTYDLSIPVAPSPQGHLAIPYARDVALRPPYSFVTQLAGSGFANGLRQVVHTDLNDPTSLSFVNVPRTVENVVLAGPRAYVSAGAAGIHVAEIAGPGGPFYSAAIPVPGQVADLEVEGAFLYAAIRSPNGALVVLRAAQVAVP